MLAATLGVTPLDLLHKPPIALSGSIYSDTHALAHPWPEGLHVGIPTDSIDHSNPAHDCSVSPQGPPVGPRMASENIVSISHWSPGRGAMAAPVPPGPAVIAWQQDMASQPRPAAALDVTCGGG